MKKVVIAIFSYCCLMALAIVFMLWQDIRAVSQLKRELAQVQSNANTVKQQAETIQAEFDELAREQRQHRPQLDGENAIVVSHAVQKLSEQLSELRKQEIAANSAIVSNQDMLEKQQLQFIPHIAFLILHVLAIWLFWPWRESVSLQSKKEIKFPRWNARRRNHRH